MFMLIIKLSIVACILYDVNLSYGASAPFITKCKADDAACIMDNAVKTAPLFMAGIPELGVEPLDPLPFDVIDASQPNLNFLIKNAKIPGLSSCKVLEIYRKKSKSKLFLKLKCSVVMHSQYEFSGQFLAVKLNGWGDLFIDLHEFPQSYALTRYSNFITNLDMDFEEKTGEDSKKYFHISKFDYTYELDDKTEVVFETLNPTSEELRTSINKFLKEDGKEILKDFSKPFFKKCLTFNVRNVNNFFKNVPVEELALD